MHFLEFSALGALAAFQEPTGRLPRPARLFDMDRDGMVLGEGGGMIVIERESVARKRGAKAHGSSLLWAPATTTLEWWNRREVTQEIAIQASFKDASYGPDKVDMVECHATSTRQGDVEEVQALKASLIQAEKQCYTSFKSQIGAYFGASASTPL